MAQHAPAARSAAASPSRGSADAQGILADPVVRIMVYVSIGLVVLFLATVIGVLTSGIVAPTGPRSSAERELLLAAARTKGATGAASAPYIEALIGAGNLPAARVALSQARASASATESVASLDLAEARLDSRDGEYEKAVTFADRSLAGYKAKYAAIAKKGGKAAEAAKTIGYGEDYYNALLVKAYALVELHRDREAVSAFDIYIVKNPTAADILIDRGSAKLRLDDKVGAAKDFKAALRFVPYDEEAKAGLKKTGVAQ